MNGPGTGQNSTISKRYLSNQHLTRFRLTIPKKKVIHPEGDTPNRLAEPGMGYQKNEYEMPLTSIQEDEVRVIAIEMFGEDTVKNLDRLFFEFHDIRAECKDNYDFLSKVMEKNGDKGEHLVAALLYGMKLGELGLMYHLKQQECGVEPPGYQ